MKLCSRVYINQKSICFWHLVHFPSLYAPWFVVCSPVHQILLFFNIMNMVRFQFKIHGVLAVMMILKMVSLPQDRWCQECHRCLPIACHQTCHQCLACHLCPCPQWALWDLWDQCHQWVSVNWIVNLFYLYKTDYHWYFCLSGCHDKLVHKWCGLCNKT